MLWSKRGCWSARRYSEHPPRDEYVPTQRGRDFRPVLVAFLAWGNEHFAPEGESVLLVDQATGKAADPILVDRVTGDTITEATHRFTAGPAAPASTRRRFGLSATGGGASGRGPRERGIPREHDCDFGRHPDPGAATKERAPAPSRTDLLLQGPIVWTLLRLASPNILVMLAQAATGLIETYFVARLGTDALAGMALVFPGVMLMQMIVGRRHGWRHLVGHRRALGAGRRDEADALVLHGVVIHVALGVFFSGHHAGVRCSRSIARSAARGGELNAALIYSNVVFAGNVLLWILNALASVIRGTGNMLVPALVICVGVVFLIPLSPCLIFGIRSVSGARHRRRRRGVGAVQCRGHRGAWLVRPLRPQCRAAAARAARAGRSSAAFSTSAPGPRSPRCRPT